MAFKPTPAWRPTRVAATQWLTLRPLAADVRYRVLRLAAVAAATGVVVALWNGIDTPGPAAPATRARAAITAPAPEVRVTTTPAADAGTAAPGAADGQAALPRPPEQTEPARPDRFVRFTVQPGDTLYDISVVYGVSIDEILQYNPALGDGTRIEVGLVVLVPQYDD